MTVCVFQCSTPLGLATVCAIRRRIMPPEASTRAVLLVSINSRYPEVDDWFTDNPEIRALASGEFDEVLVLNEEIFPTHPSSWNYHKSWTSHQMRWFDYFGGKVVDIWLESLQVPPAKTLASIFTDARIRVYSDGLMVYSPTRFKLPASMLRRVSDVYYIDYLDGVVPLLLDEAAPVYTAFDVSILSEFFTAMVSCENPSGSLDGRVLFVGQALAHHQMTTDDEEIELYVEALALLARDPRTGVPLFKPHPTAAAATNREVARRFSKLTGQSLVIVPHEVPVEALLMNSKVELIAGVFSTALFTAARMFDVPAFAFRTKDVMCKLSPYANSNRIPLLAADIYLPSVYELANRLSAAPMATLSDVARSLYSERRTEASRTFRDAQVLVGFHMQSEVLVARADEAAQLFSRADAVTREIYLFGSPLLATGGAPKGRLRVAIHTGASWIARRYLSEQKRAKFERDPISFFEDSKSGVARRLGAAYIRIAHGGGEGKP